MREIRRESVTRKLFGVRIASLQVVQSLEHKKSFEAFPAQFAKTSLPLEVTELLRSWNRQEAGAQDHVLRAVYGELHRLAHHYMTRESPGHTLQATALVNEAYLRLSDSEQPGWDGRAHFLGAFAQAMRRVLIDWARARQSEKRGANARHHSLDEVTPAFSHANQHLLEIHEALDALASIDARKARVVELRFFGGLSLEEAAQSLHVSRETVARDWRLAKSWLRVKLSSK